MCLPLNNQSIKCKQFFLAKQSDGNLNTISVVITINIYGVICIKCKIKKYYLINS